MPPYYIGGSPIAQIFNPGGRSGGGPIGPLGGQQGGSSFPKSPGGPIGPIGGPQRDGSPNLGKPVGTSPGGPIGPLGGPQTGVSPPGTTPASHAVVPPPPGSVLPAAPVRATGDPKGYDPAYLQNLATAIGGLFSNRGGMNINPLGNLSELSPASNMGGSAPLPGLPSTWLQDALNGLGFSFAPPAPAPVRSGGGGGGMGGGNRGGGGRRFDLA